MFFKMMAIVRIVKQVGSDGDFQHLTEGPCKSSVLMHDEIMFDPCSIYIN